MKISPEIMDYYNQRGESIRLGRHSLEKIRTQEIISRYLPSNRGEILDVGGATGVYAFWLSELGHRVHLVDPVPYHVEEATRLSGLSAHPLASIEAGDARHLDFPDNTFDVVLMLGPLYHLPEYKDRITALKEALRVTRPGGAVMCAVITRLAAVIDGFFKDRIGDPGFVEIMLADMRDGKHLNPNRVEGYFTTAYFHRPDEMKTELETSGWQFEKSISIESFGGLIPGVEEKLSRPEYRELLLDAIREIETDQTISGIGAHLMGIGRKRKKDREL
jgi:ubiquinone/menaquinone biosynthesis C-methylase UbiE